jgi:hypothetical protein
MLTLFLPIGISEAILWPMSDSYFIEPDKIAAAEAVGKAAASYSAPDPLDWIERSALAGVKFGLVSGGGFFSCFLEADVEEASFLDAWLHATPGAAAAVERVLRARNLPEV